MANFRRRHKRESGRRGASSDWSYVKLEKGRAERSRANIKRAITIFTERLKQYYRPE